MNRILVVSDEADVVKAVATAAYGQPMRICLASSVAEATAQASRIDTDIVLVSSSATDGDPADALARLRATAPFRRAAFVLLGSSAELAAVKDAPADDAFETPLRASELGARLRSVARLHRAVTDLDALRAQVSELNTRVPTVPTRDERSGAYDRRYLDVRLVDEVERARRYGQPLSLVRIVLHDIRSIQKQHGRMAADEAFRALGATLQRSVRRTDFVARLRGAEFIVVAPKTDETGVRALATRLESLVRALFARREPGPRRACGAMRVGTATLHGREGHASPNANELLAEAQPAAHEERATA